MAERELFQIGEVAKMYHLSVGTLRHYEQVGLLKPEYTDPATGYRYYSVRQFEQLTNIRYLRALGLPLDEIAATLHDRDVDNIAEALRRQKELIARKKQELEIMERKIDHRLAQLEDARRSELDCIRLVEQPALRLVLLRDSVKFNSYLWLERSIRKIEQDQKLPLSYIGKVGVGISGENLKSAEFGHYDLVFLVLAVLGAAYAGWHSRSWGLGLGVFAVCCAAILVLFWLRSAALTSAFSSLLGALCLFSPFETFVSGLFSLSAVVYYLSVTALFLFFTCQTLEKRRWN